MRVLAIDYGLKRIGLALSDSMQIIASPLENLQASYDIPTTVKRLADLLEKLKEQGKTVGEIVLGLPLHMTGAESERAKQVRAFAACIKETLNLPVFLLDERLTSVQAERSLCESKFSRKKRATLVDAVSAVILLQTYLSQKSIKNESFDVL